MTCQASKVNKMKSYAKNRFPTVFSLLKKVTAKLHFDFKIISANEIKEITQISTSHKNYSDIINKRLKKILNFATKYVPYYKKMQFTKIFFGKKALKKLQNFPLLDKKIIRDCGETIYSSSRKQKIAYWMNTGGSTGEPLHFPVSNNFEVTHQAALYEIMGGNSGLIVSVDGTRINEASLKNHIFWQKSNSNFPYGEWAFSTLHLSDETIPFYLEYLNTLNPVYMRGYPSGITLLANYIKKKNYKPALNLSGIYLTSEYYDNNAITLLNKVFKCPVFGQYGHSEVSIFAFTEPNKTKYYCSSYYGYTEVLDENGLPVKIGEIGEVVVTGFSNFVMPFIRYKTGDFARFGGIVNGIVILDELLGRTVDFIYDKNFEKVFLIGLVFGGHLLAFNHIIEWQIVQQKAGCIIIKIIKDINWTNEDENSIVQLFTNFDIEILYVTSIEKTARGKHQFLIQMIQENAL